MDESRRKRQIIDHHYPEEFFYEILSRVPAKYVLKLRLVCKFWRSLISEPGFIRAHLAHSIPEIIFWNPKNSQRLNYYCVNLQDNEKEAYRLPLPHDYMYAKSFCDGMLVIHTEDNPHQFSIWNPVTGSLKHLPPTQLKCQNPGLVRDRRTGKYKVFGISYQERTSHMWSERCIAVFRQGEESWKNITTEPPGKTRCNHWYPTSAKGNLYWTEILWMHGRCVSYLCSVDAATEELRDVELPFELDDCMNCLSELEGALYITNFDLEYFETWVWKDEKMNSWERCHRVQYKSFHSDMRKQVDCAKWNRLSLDRFVIVRSEGASANLLDHAKAFVTCGIGQNQIYMFDIKKKKMRKIATGSAQLPHGIHVNSLVNWE